MKGGFGQIVVVEQRADVQCPIVYYSPHPDDVFHTPGPHTSDEHAFAAFLEYAKKSVYRLRQPPLTLLLEARDLGVVSSNPIAVPHVNIAATLLVR